MARSKPDALPRVVIEQVTPQIDGGRYPIKRLEGDVVRVTAAIFKDGHDLITARVLYRRRGEAKWREVPLSYDYDTDIWTADVRPDSLGVWEYTVEAWPDHFRTWQEELKKRLSADQDVSSELLQGAVLLEEASHHAQPPHVKELTEAAKRLANSELPLQARLDVALSAEVLAATYGPLRKGDAARCEQILEMIVDRRLAGIGAWYELFPRSQGTQPGKHGTFADMERRLPEVAALGFDVIYVPPIHPIGSTHRKGRNNARVCEPTDVGSPWAIGGPEGGHDAVHPELGTMADFERMVRKANELGLEIAIDFALQCSPDHPWVKDHPQWFFVRPDGTLRYAENPPKKYEDIYPINFWCEDKDRLWQTCVDLLLFWVQRGVRIFRVDNPHTKPLAFWEWAIARVREKHPDVIFLSESFTRPNRMNSLAKLGFSQSYTYFTWKNSWWELRDYMTQLTQSEMVQYYRPNFFTNTPDILHEYLQRGGRSAFRVRLLLAATLAATYGIYSGFELCENVPVRPGSEEYLDSEKYEIRVRDWNAPGNINQDVARLNRIRRENPALQRLDNLTFVPTDYENILAYLKSAPGNDLIVIVNLDPHTVHETKVHLPLSQLGLVEGQVFEVEDLLTGIRYTWSGSTNYVRLDPHERVGHVLRIVR